MSYEMAVRTKQVTIIIERNMFDWTLRMAHPNQYGQNNQY
jgi:hypothetical protein